MARFGGGGMPNFGGLNVGKLMEQVKKMQDDAQKLQDELDTARFEAKAGGGMVTVIVNGHGHLVDVQINPAVVDPEDVEILQDLIVTAGREASEQAQKAQKDKMEAITGPMSELNLPPGLLG